MGIVGVLWVCWCSYIIWVWSGGLGVFGCDCCVGFVYWVLVGYLFVVGV